jgi:hypothetical protein
MLMSVLLLSLPYTSTHPMALLVLPVALVMPFTGEALRPLVAEAGIVLFNTFRWLLQNNNEQHLQPQQEPHHHQQITHQQKAQQQQQQVPQQHIQQPLIAHVHLNPHPHPQPLKSAQHPSPSDMHRRSEHMPHAASNASSSNPAHPVHAHVAHVAGSLDLDFEGEPASAPAHPMRPQQLEAHATHVLDARVLSNEEFATSGSSMAHTYESGCTSTATSRHRHEPRIAHEISSSSDDARLQHHEQHHVQEPPVASRPAPVQQQRHTAAHANVRAQKHSTMGGQTASHQPWLDPLLAVAPWMRSWGGFL